MSEKTATAIPVQEASSSSSNEQGNSWLSQTSKTLLKERAVRDYKLLFFNHNGVKILISFVLIRYVQAVLFRNYAFYRHRPLATYVRNPDENLLSHRLADLGHDLFPDHSENGHMRFLNEVFQYIMAAGCLTLGAAPYILDCRAGRWVVELHTTTMVTRVVMLLAFGEILRGLCFMPTSLPGPAHHCIGEEEAKNHPHDWQHLVWYPVTGKNCGDLIFSGHMFFCILSICTTWFYTNQMPIKKETARAWTAFMMFAGFFLQVPLIFMTRSHYSVDVVTGTLIALLIWLLHLEYFPKDNNALEGEAGPAHEAPALEMAREEPVSRDVVEPAKPPTHEIATQTEASQTVDSP